MCWRGDWYALQTFFFLLFLLLTQCFVFLLDYFRSLVEPDAGAVAIALKCELTLTIHRRRE